MPSFTYPSMMQPFMPPTPPEYGDFDLGVLHEARSQFKPSFGAETSLAPIHKNGRLDHPAYMPASRQHIGHSTIQPTLYLDPDPNTQQSQTFARSCQVANAPVLPPIKHIMDQNYNHNTSTEVAKTPKVKEEKTTGGVAAHLDYDMESMIDFVSETVHGLYESYISTIYLPDIDVSRSIVNSKSPVSADFRKFVSQILPSTRLPSSTILLGLCYLVNRLTILSSRSEFDYSSGIVHRMLTVALLLGSKFLDDNTFQNRSWSEVSGIPVGDINELELKWLEAFQWDMHLDVADTEGFHLWYQRWNEYKVAKSVHVDKLVNSLESTCLNNVSVPRHQTSHHSSSPSNWKFTHNDNGTGHVIAETPNWVAPRYSAWPPLSTQPEYSPPSAPETGPNTPLWYETSNMYESGFPSQSITTMQQSPPLPPLQTAAFNPAMLGYHSQHAPLYNTYGRVSGRLDTHCRSQYLAYPPPGFGYEPHYVVG